MHYINFFFTYRFGWPIRIDYKKKKKSRDSFTRAKINCSVLQYSLIENYFTESYTIFLRVANFPVIFPPFSS